MLRTAFIFFLLVSVKICCAQSKTSKVTEQDYYDFFNSLIEHDSIWIKNLSETPFFPSSIFNSDSISPEYYLDGHSKLKIFSGEDIAFMRQQLDSSKNFLWQENFHTNVVVISSKELDKYFGKRKLRWDKYYKHHEGVLSSISIPLFTQDMTECVVYIAHSCGGPCGGGCVYIYKNVNGRWIRIDQFNCWIS